MRFCALISLFISFFLFSCQKDPYKDLKKDLKKLLKKDQVEEAILLSTQAPYDSIFDPDVALLTAEAYARESLLGKKLWSKIFAKKREEIDLSLESISQEIQAYQFTKLLNLKKSVSAFYRARHDREGNFLKRFDEKKFDIFSREAILRLTYLVAQLTEFIELCETLPYFGTENLGDQSYFTLLSNPVDQIKTTHEDLRDQTSFMDSDFLKKIASFINEKKFSITSRGKSYTFSWENDFEESLYRLAKKTREKEKDYLTLSFDLKSFSHILEDLISSEKLINHLPETPISEKIEKVGLKNQNKVLEEAMKSLKKKIENLQGKEREGLLKKFALLEKVEL